MSTINVTVDIPSTPVTWIPASNVTHVYNNSVFNGTDNNKIYSDYTEYKVANFLRQYYLYVLCVIGIPGNIGSIITFLSTRPVPSSAIYMLALAISDTINLVWTTVFTRLYNYKVSIGDTGCALNYFGGTVFQQYSNWILVALAVERFIASWFPFKVKTLCTRQKAIKTLVGILVFLSLINSHFAFTYEEIFTGYSKFACTLRSEYEHFVTYIWYWIDGTLYGIFPIALITVFNVLIIYKVRKSRQVRRQLANIATSKGDAMAHQLTTMLLSVSIVFIILTLPNCLFFILKGYWSWKDTQLEIAQYVLIDQIVFVLSNFNYVVNFYMYCLSGQKFRQQFIQVMCCKKEARTQLYKMQNVAQR